MSEPIGNVVNGITTTGKVQALRSVGNLLVNANNISDLDDATITTPATGQTLIWNGSKWVNQSLYFASSLSDLVITAPQVKDRIMYDVGTAKWTNQSPYYYSFNCYGKFKDSYIQSLTGTTSFLNLLVNDTAIFDSYTLSNSESNGFTLNNTTGAIEGFRASAVCTASYNMSLSINTVNNLTSFFYGVRNLAGSTTVSSNTSANTLDIKFKALDSNFTTTLTSMTIFPYVSLSATNNYTGQATQDFSFSFSIYEI